jgi:hypothetical protein
MFARGDAFIAGFDTSFILFMCHDVGFPFGFGWFSFSERVVRKFTALVLSRGAVSLWV